MQPEPEDPSEIALSAAKPLENAMQPEPEDPSEIALSAAKPLENASCDPDEFVSCSGWKNTARDTRQRTSAQVFTHQLATSHSDLELGDAVEIDRRSRRYKDFELATSMQPEPEDPSEIALGAAKRLQHEPDVLTKTQCQFTGASPRPAVPAQKDGVDDPGEQSEVLGSGAMQPETNGPSEVVPSAAKRLQNAFCGQDEFVCCSGWKNTAKATRQRASAQVFTRQLVTSYSDLDLGDSVEIKRHNGLYKHFALVIGDGKLVHIARDRGLKAVVKEEEFSKVVGSSRAYKNNSLDAELKPKPQEDIVAAAKASYGKIDYDPLKNNCEHAVNLWRYGEKRSRQVERSRCRRLIAWILHVCFFSGRRGKE